MGGNETFKAFMALFQGGRGAPCKVSGARVVSTWMHPRTGDGSGITAWSGAQQLLLVSRAESLCSCQPKRPFASHTWQRCLTKAELQQKL